MAALEDRAVDHRTSRQRCPSVPRVHIAGTLQVALGVLVMTGGAGVAIAVTLEQLGLVGREAALGAGARRRDARACSNLELLDALLLFHRAGPRYSTGRGARRIAASMNGWSISVSAMP